MKLRLFAIPSSLLLATQLAAAPVPAAPPGGAPVPSAPPVAAPSPVVEPVQTPVEALGEDAGEYARLYGVPIADAYRRLAAQQASLSETDRLQAQYRDRLAGLFFEHSPFRIVILLTGDAPVADRSIRAGGLDIPVTFRTGAMATRVRWCAWPDMSTSFRPDRSRNGTAIRSRRPNATESCTAGAPPT